jgi:uncharacterized repeat protein (TIGR03837 family)
MSDGTRLRWDIYCQVIDNYGDAGVCWRLAADLAGRGDAVRLVIDDPRPLAFMAPRGAAGVTVQAWPGASDPTIPSADVVIEAFGCELPQAAVEAMLEAQAEGRHSVWINLEYLSAEGYVERVHGLPSPQHNGLSKWFYFPGLTPRTGGLLREQGLKDRRDRFDRRPWLASQGIQIRPGERVVSLFCYANAHLPWLLNELASRPTLLLLTPGPAQDQVGAAPDGLRLHRLPHLSQVDFDHLLWASDLNFVRGEDSLVRALWAGVPFVWQAYPQADDAHLAKVEAMLQVLLAPPAVQSLWRAWNGAGPPTRRELIGPDSLPWPALCLEGDSRWWAQTDLATGLRRFAHDKALSAGYNFGLCPARVAPRNTPGATPEIAEKAEKAETPEKAEKAFHIAPNTPDSKP